MRFFEFYQKINELAPMGQPAPAGQPPVGGQPAAPAMAPTVPPANAQGQGTSPPIPQPDPNLAQGLKSLQAAAGANPQIKTAYDAFMKQLQAGGVTLPGMQPAQQKPPMVQPAQPQAKA